MCKITSQLLCKNKTYQNLAISFVRLTSCKTIAQPAQLILPVSMGYQPMQKTNRQNRTGYSHSTQVDRYTGTDEKYSLG